MYVVADRLHKTLSEVGAMSIDEFDGWLEYIRETTKQQQKS